ncbi:MAG: hypothetical protein K5910_03600, partial [Bacteroidales bacterium]|nr:hypothetical protein [Bacteroidales bacterium]
MKTVHFHLLSLAAAALLLSACQAGSGSKSKLSSAVSSAASGTPMVVLDTEGTVPDGSDVDPEVPTIRFVSKGSILPSSGSLDLLFGSVSYAKAQVRVKKVFTNNILQFLQFDTYETRYEIYKVAGQIADTTIVLGDRDADHIREWRTYALSLNELVKPDPGAIYHIEIRGREPLAEEDFWDSDSYFGDYSTYEQRSVDLLASNLALIAKRGDGGATDVFAYDILSGKPASGVRVKLYDFVQQELAKGETDRDGHVAFRATEGRFLTATSGKNFAYLDLKNEKSLSTSNFDVSGTSSEGGIKAYIFGERGVWRPGDTLHVSVVPLFDDAPLPAGHPVVARLYNPDGQLTQTLTAQVGSGQIYHFPFTTAQDAPSGRWRTDVTLGGQTFSKVLRVEAIKPNKMDITLHFQDDYITPDRNCTGDIAVRWLYGAPGAGLKVNGTIELSAAKTSFKGWESYDFQDDARSFESQTLSYGDMVTDSQGHTSINTFYEVNRSETPGLLTAGFTFRAFEPGGDFSTAYSSIRMSPFPAYVGIKTEMDRDEWGDTFLTSGKAHRFDVATVDAEGKGISTGALHAEIYHVDW